LIRAPRKSASETNGFLTPSGRRRLTAARPSPTTPTLAEPLSSSSAGAPVITRSSNAKLSIRNGAWSAWKLVTPCDSQTRVASQASGSRPALRSRTTSSSASGEPSYKPDRSEIRSVPLDRRATSRAKKSASSLVGSLFPSTSVRGALSFARPGPKRVLPSSGRASRESSGMPEAGNAWIAITTCFPITLKTTKRARSPRQSEKAATLARRSRAQPLPRGDSDLNDESNCTPTTPPTTTREMRLDFTCGLRLIQAATSVGKSVRVPHSESKTPVGWRKATTPVWSFAFCLQHAEPDTSTTSVAKSCPTRQRSSRTVTANGVLKRVVT
jgi:hypothetical protein